MLFPRRTFTLSQRMEEVGAASSGFDYMRIGLAISILCWHTISTLHGVGFERPYWDKCRMVVGGLLPMFFVLSGFLVSGSLARTGSVGKFFSLRAIRLYPALAVEVLLSALLLGPLLTTVPLSEYFSSSEFWAYFHNIIGYITYPLPGLFNENPVANITNISLWTIPYELECYICLALIAVFGLHRRRVLLLAGLLLIIIVKTSMFARLGVGAQFSRPDGRLLVASFLGGVVAYFYKDKIPYNGFLFVVALLLQLILTRNVVTAWVAIIPTIYVTVYLGLLNPPKYTFLMRGDYSYGLYLFAFPIQQTYSLLFPHHRVWWLSIGFSLCLGIAYAALSWHLIEKPILRRKTEIIGRLTLASKQIGRMVVSGWRNDERRLGAGAGGERPKA